MEIPMVNTEKPSSLQIEQHKELKKICDDQNIIIVHRFGPKFGKRDIEYQGRNDKNTLCYQSGL